MITTYSDKKFVIRCRAIILHEDKLLVVRHTKESVFAALPGGHLEYGEDPVSCMKREIVEELGIEPVIGRLLYVNSFVDGDVCHSIEFFFEVKNGYDYIDCDKLVRSHSHELSEIIWVGVSDDVKILPKDVEIDFKNGHLLLDQVRFINGSKK